MAAPRDRIPVSILTGFLGAGKSTLLNRILKDPAMRNAAVIINEFGDVGIDHLLVESADDAIVELSDGCLCCTVRGALVDTLAMLIDRVQTGRTKTISRIVIETTGLADPAPVMQSVLGNPILSETIALEGVVTVVDAVNGLSSIDRHPEALKQAAVADRLVLSKADLASEETVSALSQRLTALNPTAPLLRAELPEAGLASLFDNGLYDAATKMPDVARWLHAEEHHGHHHHDHHDHEHGHHHHHHHDPGQSAGDVNRHDGAIRSFSIVHDRPISPMALEMFVDLLRSAHGDKLLRMKAIVDVAGETRPIVLHGVQAVFHPPERLAAWPDPADRRTRMVLITRDLPERFVRDLFDAFTGKPVLDRPDAQALSDNPLAIPGVRL